MTVALDTLILGAQVATLGVADDYGLLNEGAALHPTRGDRYHRRRRQTAYSGAR